MNDRGTPRLSYIKTWSEETHVPLDWFETGQTPDAGASPLASPDVERPFRVPYVGVERRLLGATVAGRALAMA